MASSTINKQFSAEYKEELRAALEEFYHTFAKPKALPEKDLEYFKATVAEVLKRVMKKEPRFDFVPHNVGSVASGDAAVVPCDLDILLCLDIDGSAQESELSPGYAKFKLAPSSAQVWQDVASEQYLDPGKLTALLRSHVKNIIAEMELQGTFHVGGDFSAAVALKMSHGSYLMKADLVLAVRRRGWPASADQKWSQISLKHLPESATTSSSILNTSFPEKFAASTTDADSQRQDDFLNKKTPATLSDYGHDMVANRISEQNMGVADMGLNRDLLWRLSLSRAETLMLRSVYEYRENERKCLVIFKAIRLYDLAEEYGFQTPIRGFRDSVSYMFTSYHLKTLCLHRAHFSTLSSTDCELVDCFLSFLNELHSTFNVSVFGMPSFFFPKTSVFPHGTLRNAFIWKLHDDPLAYFRSILPINPSAAYSVSFF